MARSKERKSRGVCGPITGGAVEEINRDRHVEDLKRERVEECKRKCGCLRTSDKLKELLDTFPAPPPPTPMQPHKFDKAVGYGYGHVDPMQMNTGCCAAARMGKMPYRRRSLQIMLELVTILQLAVTATALALYYLIYCYMQLVYYTLSCALYFHHADGPMKISIAVVTVTSLIVAFNILMRMEGIIGIFY